MAQQTMLSPTLTINRCCAGMAATKLHTTAAQSAAMGMVGPRAGMQHLQQLLATASTGVIGSASSTYWRLLLRSVRQPPAIFQDVLLGTNDRAQVRPRTLLERCKPLFFAASSMLTRYVL